MNMRGLTAENSSPILIKTITFCHLPFYQILVRFYITKLHKSLKSEENIKALSKGNNYHLQVSKDNEWDRKNGKRK